MSRTFDLIIGHLCMFFVNVVFFKIYVIMYICIYFWILCSLLLICLSILMSIYHTALIVVDRTISKSDRVSPPTFFFFFKILAIPDSLHFQMNFRILSISIKWPTGILIRLALYLQINLEKIDNF